MLDPEGVKDITNLICDLKNKYHKTIITITHDLDLAALSDRVIVLKDGLIIGEGKPLDIFKDEDILKQSRLDMPFNLKLYKTVKENEKLNKNERLLETLWKLNS